jgi:hypothetical protein
VQNASFRPEKKTFFFNSMSVILLTSRPSTLEEVKVRDTSAVALTGTSFIMGKMNAVYHKKTLDHLYMINGCETYRNRCQTSCVSVGEGWWLRIIHDGTIMGPKMFLNVGAGAHTCPWGIWVLYKSDFSDIRCCVTLDEKEALKGCSLARSYTWNESDQNRKMAKHLGYT